MDARQEIEQLMQPFRDQLDGCYTDGGEGENIDHSRIRSELWDAVGERMDHLGFLQGVIEGAGISWTLHEIYFMPPKPLSDGVTWVLFALWFDDNEYRWQFNDCGRLELGAVSMAAAAHALLKKFVKPGSDRNSNEDYEDLLEEWRCNSLGLPVPESRREARFIAQLLEREDRMAPHQPSVRDAKFTEDELTAAILSLVVVARADGLLHENESARLETIARDLSFPKEWIANSLDMVTTQAVSFYMLKVLGKVKLMREAKRVWLGQYMYIMSMVDGHQDESEKEVWLTISSAMGLTGPEGVDIFSDMPIIQAAAKDVNLAWDFTPKWPFMPCSVEILSHAEVGSPIVPVNDDGALILWMKLDGLPNRLDVRLNHRNGRFSLKAECGGVSPDDWTRDFELQPLFSDIMRLLVQPSGREVIDGVEANSPLGMLLGGGMEIRDWNPRHLGGAVTQRIEFDEEEHSAEQGGLSQLFGKRRRRCLEISSCFHVPQGVMEKFLKGEIPPKFKA